MKNDRRHLSLRFAGPGDGEFVAALAPRFVESGVPAWRSHRAMVSGTVDRLKAALEAGNTDRSAILIACDDSGQPAGFVWVLMVEDFYGGPLMGKVSEIAVTRSGAGTGRFLMDAAEQWARERGAVLMVLNALETNTEGRRFYSSRGYEAEYTAFIKRL